MSAAALPLISIVLPLYDEQAGLVAFHHSLSDQLAKIHGYRFEVVYCNDGSNDGSLAILHELAKDDARIRIVSLSRNFGKEIATTAGIQTAKGVAVVTLDSDGQHPIELLPKFINQWEAGSKVVIGMCEANQRTGAVKRFGSWLFYKSFNRFTKIGLVSGASDFRLIDQTVQADFVRLTERNRITRGLIDWLGYERTYIRFTAKSRMYDAAAYSFPKLFKLAIDSFISLSSFPLHVTAYIGAFVLPVSILLGAIMVINQLLGDPFNWQVTGGAYVSVFMLFLFGIMLMSQGILGLYLSHIHSETQNRPLYIVDKEASLNL